MQSASDAYSGVENLEVMEVAHRYRRYLGELISAAGGPPRAGHKTLDFGAGVGTYARVARQLGYAVTCCELDPTLRRRLSEDGFTTTAALCELPDGQFDFAYTLNVLEHIDDDATTLASILRALAPGGRLLIYVPAFPILFSAMDRKVGHVRRYRRRQLVERVEEAGFMVQSCRHADSLGFVASLVLRIAPGGDGTLNVRTVALYDRWVFPLSRRLDRLTAPVIGKNLALVAIRPGQSP